MAILGDLATAFAMGSVPAGAFAFGHLMGVAWFVENAIPLAASAALVIGVAYSEARRTA